MAGTLLQHDAKQGDLIEIFRGLHEDWAVYVGNDEVVYLTLERNKSSDGQRQTKVKCGNIWEVISSDNFEVNNLLDKECKPRNPADIVREALQMVGQKWSCSSTSRISQQFVTELRYGKAETGQRKHGAKRGDLIEIYRRAYQHWAVYVGDEEVVHLTNTGVGSSAIFGENPGQVTRDNIWIVVNSDKFRVNNLLDHKYKPREPRVIVEEACDMVGQPVSYSLTSHNCEHFATELRYGKAESRQLQHDAKQGDLIEIFRDLHEDWAVYVGNDEVVYLTLKRNKSSGGQRQPTVKCGKIWKVIRSDNFKVNNLLDKECKPRNPADIVNEALQMVGQKWSCSSTSQISQQFATELRYGKAETGQREHGAKPGDLIEIFRQHYQHWAVYVGDDEVVHLTNTGHCSSGISCRSSGQVTRDNIWIVVSSDKFKINNLLDHKHMPRETRVIVKEACDMVGQPVSYSLTTHNCEHFATELRYGKATSRQAPHAAAVSAIAGGGLAGVLFSVFAGIAALFGSR